METKLRLGSFSQKHFNKDGKVLLQHRTKDSPIKPDYWGFFGGHIEEGEHPEVAARREFKEELQIEIGGKIKFFKQVLVGDEGWGGPNEKNFYTFQLDSDLESLKTKQLEGDNLGFFSFEEIRGLKISNSDLNVLREFFSSKNKFVASV